MPVKEDAGQRVVPIGEYVRLDAHDLAQASLRREAPGVDLRHDGLDDHSPPAVQPIRGDRGKQGRLHEPPFHRSASHDLIACHM
jgi:hypothetical protein